MTDETRASFIVLDFYIQLKEIDADDAYTRALDFIDKNHDDWLITDSSSDKLKDIITRLEKLI